MPLDDLKKLRLHVINVDHGDAMILEFPNYNKQARFAIVDTGRPETRYRFRLRDYFKELLDLRELTAADYRIDFLCVTHPHEDHFGGLGPFLEAFSPQISQFWDCGFRTAAKTYNKLLDQIADMDGIMYIRVASGFEIELGRARIDILAPSLSLRNRFDTFGVDRNNASVVLKVRIGNSIAILAGDAYFDSWGKIADEFPRTSKITYFKDANVERSEGVNQLNCQVLKVSHHGSKRGTSFEYLEKLKPRHFIITCGNKQWYETNKPGWGTEWPHPLTEAAIKEVHTQPEIRFSHLGNLIYSFSGASTSKQVQFKPAPGEPGFRQKLQAALVSVN
jgi:beta-lactamase superfamily II metal-dependent hydrolase